MPPPRSRRRLLLSFSRADFQQCARLLEAIDASCAARLRRLRAARRPRAHFFHFPIFAFSLMPPSAAARA